MDNFKREFLKELLKNVLDDLQQEIVKVLFEKVDLKYFDMYLQVLTDNYVIKEIKKNQQEIIQLNEAISNLTKRIEELEGHGGSGLLYKGGDIDLSRYLKSKGYIRLTGRHEIDGPIRLSGGDYTLEGVDGAEVVAKGGCAFEVEGGTLRLRGIKVSTKGVIKEKGLIEIKGGGRLEVLKGTLSGGYRCISADGSTVVLQDSSISNVADIGIWLTSSTAEIERCKVEKNRDDQIYVDDSKSRLIIKDSEVRGPKDKCIVSKTKDIKVQDSIIEGGIRYW